MLPFEAPTLFEQLPRFLFKMPRVHQDQKSKYDSDELFRRLGRESEVRSRLTCRLAPPHQPLSNLISCTPLVQVRYTGFRDRPLQERQIRFKNACLEGHTDLVSIARPIHQSCLTRPPRKVQRESRCLCQCRASRSRRRSRRQD